MNSKMLEPSGYTNKERVKRDKLVHKSPTARKSSVSKVKIVRRAL